MRVKHINYACVCPMHGRCLEVDHCDDNGGERKEPGRECGNARHVLFTPILVDAQINAMEQAVDEVSPGTAMP